MKKLLSTIIAMGIILSASVNAFAADTPDKKSVLNEIDSIVGYLTSSTDSFKTDDAVNYYYLTEISHKADSFYEGFSQDVLESLENNSGHIVPSYGENFATTAACVMIIARFESPVDFHGYNLVELLNNTQTDISNPYYYDIAIPASAKYCDAATSALLCQSFIDDYFTSGSGMDYYGYACDNDAMFASSISQSKLEEYTPYAEEALSLMDTNYKVDGGYCYNPMYSNEATTDSIALAMRAKCAYLLNISEPSSTDMDELAQLYYNLLANKGDVEGSYNYMGYESPISAGDALKGLNLYYLLLNEGEDEAESEATTTQPSTAVKSENSTAKANSKKTSPKTGEGAVLPVSASLIGACALALIIKRKSN